ncbi:MAG TPA: beta-1-3, beta-1-6-glucan biosynthesis protein [Xanthobacteraceae bacterium]|nr:beta-1-3, beta-1-6-glucan biosynthesis protein [Xanthobacteraceae bacterium]
MPTNNPARTKMSNIQTTLRSVLRVILTAALLAAMPVSAALAQSADKPADQKATDAAKEAAAKDQQKRIDEIAEAGRLLKGPAANAECVWLGRRVVSLLWRDDLDTAFRHFDLYDRFGCPGEHVQMAFRCVVKQGPIDPKAPDTLNSRVHGCWLNPELPNPPAAAAQVPAQPGEGTTTR